MKPKRDRFLSKKLQQESLNVQKYGIKSYQFLFVCENYFNVMLNPFLLGCVYDPGS